jgi:D-glutamate N-acetyltransferase
VIPPLRELVELHERLALPARPARVGAIALNTRRLSEEEAREAVAAAEAETGLAADDPVRFGSARLVAALLEAG